MVDTPDERNQPASSTTRARSGTNRAETWGIATWPSPSNRSVISQVASWPFTGDAVTETVEPSGSISMAASRLLSGMTSKVSPAMSPRR